MKKTEVLSTISRAIAALEPLVEHEDSNGYPYAYLVQDLDKVYKAIQKQDEAKINQ